MISLNVAKIEKMFNKISLRERVLIFCGLLICVSSISYFWIFEPAILKQVKAEKVLASVVGKENKLNNDIAEAKLRLQKDPLREINNKIAFSSQTLAKLNKQLEDKLVKFIHAKKMPIALSKVLSKSPGVKVLSLTTLPIKTFDLSEDAVKGAKNIFYKHTLEIKLTGGYDAIYQYFLNLENVPEKFYWSVLTYEVSDYPRAEVMIQIYTLSDQQDLVSG